MVKRIKNAVISWLILLTLLAFVGLTIATGVVKDIRKRLKRAKNAK